MAVNHYGRMAMEHTRRHLPRAFSAIADPIRHFADLGEEVQAAVTSARDKILGRQRTDETIAEFRDRSHQAMRTAEEIVLTELVWLPPEPTTEQPDPDEGLAGHYRRLEEIGETLSQDW